MNNELANSINYIKEKTGKDSGFSIPKDYLTGIEDDFMMKLKEEKLPKTTSFDTPNTYFDNLESEILDKITSTKEKKGKVISLKSKLRTFIPASIAASLLLFIGLQFLNTKTNTSINFDELSSMDIENWFDETTTYSNTELAFTFEDDLDDSELAFSTVNINNDAIEDYFSSIDHSDLINETH